MNKISKTCVGILSICFLTLCAVSVLNAEPAAPKREPLKEDEAGIVHVEGAVQVTSASGAVIKADEGVRLPEGARIQTEKGRLQIGMGPDLGKSVLVEEKSAVTVTPKDDTQVDIERGCVFAVLDKVKPGAPFQLETPRGIAGVRGTTLQIKSLPSADKDTILVANGAVTAYTLDYKELGTVAAGNKGHMAENQPLFTEPLTAQDVKVMDGLSKFTDVNKRDFSALVGGFAGSSGAAHPPKKTGPAGGKPSKRPAHDPEAGPTGPGGGFIQTESRQFMDNRYMGQYDQQRKSLQQPRKEPPPRESSDSHP